MLTAEDLRKSFGSINAVDGVSLEIRRGETFGLLGPNGAGKTTTIQMLTGMMRPDVGRVTIDGRGSPSTAAARAAIGLAPQSLSIYEELTANENITFFARLYALSGARLRERVDWALELAGLAERRRDRAGTFSGGMKRRLNIACALVHEPEILVCDEPTVGVDPQSRNHIFEAIERLRDDGLTILYTTHYMEEAERLCDRVAIMDAGRILDIDAVDALIDRHGGESLVTAELERPPAADANLPGEIDGVSLRLQTASPFEDVARINACGVPLRTLNIRRPDLETVFLALTGRSLRD